MSTIVYQGLQSCFESQLIETTTLKLRVAAAAAASVDLPRAPKCLLVQEISSKKAINVAAAADSNKQQTAAAGWSLIQNLSSNNASSSPAIQSSYVHPLTRTSPRLSQKSLELCTENLGSETGSDGLDIGVLSFSDEESSAPPEKTSISTSRQVESRNHQARGGSSCFPPPLTTIRSSNSIQVRPRREDGRLIIQAIETPSRNTYLQAERSNGRLRLSFLSNDCCASNNEEKENEGDVDEDDVFDEYESDIDDHQEDNYNNSQEEAEAAEQGDDDDHQEEDMDGNRIEAEGDFGIDKFQRPSRCKESGHGNNKNLCDWRNPLWVATS